MHAEQAKMNKAAQQFINEQPDAMTFFDGLARRLREHHKTKVELAALRKSIGERLGKSAAKHLESISDADVVAQALYLLEMRRLNTVSAEEWTGGFEDAENMLSARNVVGPVPLDVLHRALGALEGVLPNPVRIDLGDAGACKVQSCTVQIPQTFAGALE
jgi:hypothetical protein